MGLIGYWGQERFEVSSSSVLTFDGFQLSTAARFESFNRIGQKPLTEYIAPGLDTISFSIKIDVMLGVNPRQVLDHWTQLAAAGNPDVLVVGNKVVGTDMWIIKTAAQTWEKLDGNGNVLTSTISLTLEEYMNE
jgi:phage protein U